MTNTLVGMRRKIGSAQDLHGVVRAMKTIAASGVAEYERSLLALEHYRRTVELGLGACLRSAQPAGARPRGTRPVRDPASRMTVFVFGSDQGLVGQFNESVANFAVQVLAEERGEQQVWAVGEHADTALAGAGVQVAGMLAVPATLQAIPDLVGQVLDHAPQANREGTSSELHLFFNRPEPGEVPVPVHAKLLPLDEAWRREMMDHAWPTRTLPQVFDRAETTLAALIGEYLFIAIYAACAQSLASENSSRLAAMERADRNIADMLADLGASYHRMRQASIDEELFDVISGFESLAAPHGAQ